MGQMWHFSKAFGSKNYRLAVSGEKHLATMFATSWKMYAMWLSCRPTSAIAIVFTDVFIVVF